MARPMGTKDSPSAKHQNQANHIDIATSSEDIQIQQAAACMNVDIQSLERQIKDYGEYAVVLANTKSVLDDLQKVFSVGDSTFIYVMSIIHLIEQYTSSGPMKEIFESSILSNKWPDLPVNDDHIREFWDLLGSHPIQCDQYAQILINQSSGLISIDGHVILSCPREKDLADYVNRFQAIESSQVRLLQAYDAENDAVLASKAFENGLLNQSSIWDLGFG